MRDLRCCICIGRDGHKDRVLVKCRTCQMPVHESCYGLPCELDDFQCHGCMSEGKMIQTTLGELTQVGVPRECFLCNFVAKEGEMLAMHALFNTYGPEGLQRGLLRKCAPFAELRKPRRAASVHTLCALYLTIRYGNVYGCFDDGSYEERAADTSATGAEQDRISETGDEQSQATGDCDSYTVAEVAARSNVVARNERTDRFVILTQEDAEKADKKDAEKAEKDDAEKAEGDVEKEKWLKIFNRIAELRALRCEVCHMTSQTNQCWIPAECSFGSPGELEIFREIFRDAPGQKKPKPSEQCEEAFHIGCAMWGITKQYIPEEKKRVLVRRIYFFPGDDTDAPCAHGYCQEHAVIVRKGLKRMKTEFPNRSGLKVFLPQAECDDCEDDEGERTPLTETTPQPPARSARASKSTASACGPPGARVVPPAVSLGPAVPTEEGATRAESRRATKLGDCQQCSTSSSTEKSATTADDERVQLTSAASSDCDAEGQQESASGPSVARVVPPAAALDPVVSTEDGAAQAEGGRTTNLGVIRKSQHCSASLSAENCAIAAANEQVQSTKIASTDCGEEGQRETHCDEPIPEEPKPAPSVSEGGEITALRDSCATVEDGGATLLEEGASLSCSCSSCSDSATTEKLPEAVSPHGANAALSCHSPAPVAAAADSVTVSATSGDECCGGNGGDVQGEAGSSSTRGGRPTPEAPCDRKCAAEVKRTWGREDRPGDMSATEEDGQKGELDSPVTQSRRSSSRAHKTPRGDFDETSREAATENDKAAVKAAPYARDEKAAAAPTRVQDDGVTLLATKETNGLAAAEVKAAPSAGDENTATALVTSPGDEATIAIEAKSVDEAAKVSSNEAQELRRSSSRGRKRPSYLFEETSREEVNQTKAAPSIDEKTAATAPANVPHDEATLAIKTTNELAGKGPPASGEKEKTATALLASLADEATITTEAKSGVEAARVPSNDAPKTPRSSSRARKRPGYFHEETSQEVANETKTAPSADEKAAAPAAAAVPENVPHEATLATKQMNGPVGKGPAAHGGKEKAATTLVASPCNEATITTEAKSGNEVARVPSIDASKTPRSSSRARNRPGYLHEETSRKTANETKAAPSADEKTAAAAPENVPHDETTLAIKTTNELAGKGPAAPGEKEEAATAKVTSPGDDAMIVTETRLTAEAAVPGEKEKAAGSVTSPGDEATIATEANCRDEAARAPSNDAPVSRRSSLRARNRPGYLAEELSRQAAKENKAASCAMYTITAAAEPAKALDNDAWRAAKKKTRLHIGAEVPGEEEKADGSVMVPGDKVKNGAATAARVPCTNTLKSRRWSSRTPKETNHFSPAPSTRDEKAAAEPAVALNTNARLATKRKKRLPAEAPVAPSKEEKTVAAPVTSPGDDATLAAEAENSAATEADTVNAPSNDATQASLGGYRRRAIGNSAPGPQTFGRAPANRATQEGCRSALSAIFLGGPSLTRPAVEFAPDGLGPVKNPGPFDVLCEEGCWNSPHGGNVWLTSIVRIHGKSVSDGKLDINDVASDIAAIVWGTVPGRFLRPDRATGLYREIGCDEARKIIRHALIRQALGYSAKEDSKEDSRKRCRDESDETESRTPAAKRTLQQSKTSLAAKASAPESQVDTASRSSRVSGGGSLPSQLQIQHNSGDNNSQGTDRMTSSGSDLPAIISLEGGNNRKQGSNGGAAAKGGTKSPASLEETRANGGSIEGNDSSRKEPRECPGKTNISITKKALVRRRKAFRPTIGFDLDGSDDSSDEEMSQRMQVRKQLKY